MSELHLGRMHERPYGWRADGIVETENHDIHVTVREPANYIEESGLTYVMANGWTTGKSSMRLAAQTAAQFGHRAVTLEYSNTGTRNALDANVQDVMDVLDAEPDDMKRSLIGLSMGGAVVTMAAARTGHDIATVTAVAPAKFIDRIRLLELPGRVLGEGGEFASIGRHPLQAFHLAMTGLGNCTRRPRAVVSELPFLLTGTVHDDVRAIKDKPNAPHFRFMPATKDKLLPFASQMASIVDLPIDEVAPYIGGHSRIAHDPTLSQSLFESEAQVLAKRSGPTSLAA